MNKNKIRAKVIERGYTLKQVAEELEISHTALTNKLNEKSYFNILEVKKLKEMLDLTNAEMVEMFIN